MGLRCSWGDAERGEPLLTPRGAPLGPEQREGFFWGADGRVRPPWGSAPPVGLGAGAAAVPEGCGGRVKTPRHKIEGSGYRVDKYRAFI